jgi:Fe-S cluster assembly protein SufD
VPFERASSSAPTSAVVAPYLFNAQLANHIVVVNGRFSAALSTLPAGVTVRTLRDGAVPGRADLGGHATAFSELNTALFEDMVEIDIAPKVVVEQPIHVLFLGHGATSRYAAPRLRVSAGELCQATVIESYADSGSASAFVNAVTEVDVAAGAIVDHVKLQRHAETTFHVSSMVSHIDRGGTLTSHAVTLGGRIVRNDIVSVLTGEGAECTLNGLYVVGGDSLVDNHTTIDHAKAHCPSHEVYKGILAGHARAVFNGKIIVRPDAQKTNAKQTNKALLLTGDAQINTKPQLEIFADDVKCTHGAAIGQLDEDALFYLRARGVGAAEARNMLIHAFAGDVLNGIRTLAVQDEAMRLVEEKLSIG